MIRSNTALQRCCWARGIHYAHELERKLERADDFPAFEQAVGGDVPTGIQLRALWDEEKSYREGKDGQ